MRPPRSALAAVIAVCLLAQCDPPAARAEADLAITKASIGPGGRFKSGFWNPVWLTVQAGPQGAQGKLEVIIPDGDQVPVIYGEQAHGELQLAVGQEASILLYAKTGPLNAPVRVQLRGEAGVVWSQDISRLLTEPLLPTQELVVSIGPPVDLESVQAIVKRPNAVAMAVAQVESASELPDRWWGYEGVDAIVLTTSDEQFLGQWTSEQRTALIQWVQLGGKLVLCVGLGGERVLAEGSPWAALAPGKLADVAPLRGGTDLETFTGHKLPHGSEPFEQNRPLASRLSAVEGLVLVQEGGAITANQPLVVRSPHGLGQVAFVGLDLDHPGFAAWKGRPHLLARLLEGNERHDRSERETARSVTHLGYEDLVGQLRAALDQFPAVALVSFTTVSVLTIVYLLLAGPGDYLLLSRLGWPRHWTWISFPLIAAAMGLAAWLLGGQSHGQRTRLNRAEIVDLDATLGVVRGTAWAHLYSPATSHFDPELRFELPAGLSSTTPGEPAGWLAWQGLPGDSLGGLGSRQVALAAAEPYSISPPGPQPQIANLPVQVASSKSLSARWWMHAELQSEPNLSVNPFGVLAGDFRQPLPVELTDCLLIHGEKLFRLGKVPAGQKVHMEDFPPLNLEARLTQRTVVDAKDVSTPWDQASVDVPRILLTMMFHDAARGSSYTGLTNRYQPYLDLTDHVRLGRAVLVGRASAGLTQLQTAGGEPLVDPADVQSWTWFRIVLPVLPLQPATP